MLEALAQGAATVFRPDVMLVIILASWVAVIFGIMPGISGTTAMVLFLPYVYKMSPEIALPAVVSLTAVAVTGGGITAILLNIPGTVPNAATLLDGYPMNQKGEGARAIGAAVMASTMGGIATVPIAILMMPLVLPVILAFKFPELCLLVVVGLSFLAALGGGSPVKGLIAGGLGLLISLIGQDTVTGIYRFTFGIPFLAGGLRLIPIALGLFAVPEMVDLIAKGQKTIARQTVTGGMSGMLQGVKDVFVHKWLWFRCVAIGYIIGLIPGVGGETGIWICYGHAKQTSKNREKFGTGCVEGVIAPETAHNAEKAGDLLTTMALGIPGSTTMSIMIGAFMLVGVTPGPAMLTDRLPLAFTLLVGIATANVVAGVTCLLAAPHLSKVAFVNIYLLFPAVMVLVFIGAFVPAKDLLDLIVLIVFSLLGIAMKRWGYSRPSLLLGFVLGDLFEFYLLRSLLVYGPLFFVTPICMVLIASLIGLFGYPYRRKLRWFRRGVTQI